tara:strand:+ start:944 stop:1123 length:180 start_codon:yes stop_codon:yes gene_type:complete
MRFWCGIGVLVSMIAAIILLVVAKWNGLEWLRIGTAIFLIVEGVTIYCIAVYNDWGQRR